MRTNHKEDLIVDLKGLYVSFRTFKGCLLYTSRKPELLSINGMIYTARASKIRSSYIQKGEDRR